MSINQRIRQIRQTLDLPQTKFAERIAISTGYIAEIELGKRKATERIIRLISMEFGVDEYWLRTGDGSVFDDGADARSARANSLFKSLNPKFQECALNVLSELAELNDSMK